MGRSGVDIMQTQNSEPDAILRQAVAVIDKTKLWWQRRLVLP